MPAKKRSVGLILIIDVPGYGRVAVLQKRGEFNHETMKPESWPGACQVTVHGGRNDGDSYPYGTLLRETGEELSEDFLDALYVYCFGEEVDLDNPPELDFKEITTEVAAVDTDTQEARTYAMYVSDPGVLKSIRLNASSGGLRLVTEFQIECAHSLEDGFNKYDGVRVRDFIAMFPDELDAIKKAFALFRHIPVAG